jgi:uncharacterized LabA/DUF88 family protein
MLGLGLGLNSASGRPNKAGKTVTKYLFIDGGFIDAMIPKTANFLGIDLSSMSLDYRAMSAGFQRTFYYDALPSKKDSETDEMFDGKFAAKLKVFERINRTPFMHTREGITRSRSTKRMLQQKGVDILLAIDVFKHASLNNMSEAHIMTKDLDFFPLFEALRDTPVSVHLHCHTDETSEELMSLADVVIPITPFTVLRWLQHPDREQFVERNVSITNIRPSTVFKEGVCDGLPFYIFKEPHLGERPFIGQSMAINPNSLLRSDRWELIVAEFEGIWGKRVYFDP